MFNFNLDSSFSELIPNQLNDISKIDATTFLNEQSLFPEFNRISMLGSSSYSNILMGGEGNDTLKGDTGEYSIIGGEGDDVLIADGNDLMMGGGGADIFSIISWSNPESANTILDFNPSMDKIEISSQGIDFNSLTFEETNGTTNIYEQGNLLAILTGVDEDSLTSENFIFDNMAIADPIVINLDTSIPESQTPEAAQNLLGFDLNNLLNFGNFFNDVISQILSGTTLQDVFAFFVGQPSNEESQSISISTYTDSSNFDEIVPFN